MTALSRLVFDASDRHCRRCHCPNHHYHRHHSILLLLLLSARSQRDCACDEKPSMHTKRMCRQCCSAVGKKRHHWATMEMSIMFKPLPSPSHSVSLFLANCISVYGTERKKKKRDWGINKAGSPEALHSQAAWEPAASAKTPAEGEIATERWWGAGRELEKRESRVD